MIDEPNSQDINTDFVSDQVKKTNKFIGVALIFICFSFLSFYLVYLNQAPKNFPVDSPLIITEGSTARDIIWYLAENNYVHSASWLYLVLSYNFGAENIKAGKYTLEEPLSTFEISSLITASAPPSETVALTFPEGYSVVEFGNIAAKSLTGFDVKIFTDLAKSNEGRLFPDTYAVPANFTEIDLVNLMLQNYEEKIAPLKTELESNNLTEAEVINLASIVEREANTIESMKLVAGILSKRLALGMPLQADATMEYILEKDLQDLTADDLKIDTPYNTYLYKGLPPTPIGNPGLSSILAVINPEPSDYLFYLTDENGVFHYAETFDEHKQNIARYLR